MTAQRSCVEAMTHSDRFPEDRGHVRRTTSIFDIHMKWILISEGPRVGELVKLDFRTSSSDPD